jgi:hypothetical protein
MCESSRGADSSPEDEHPSDDRAKRVKGDGTVSLFPAGLTQIRSPSNGAEEEASEL